MSIEHYIEVEGDTDEWRYVVKSTKTQTIQTVTHFFEITLLDTVLVLEKLIAIIVLC